MSALATTKRILAWCFLLGGAVMAFILAGYLTNRNIGASFVVASQSYGLIENWALSLISLSIGGCVYVLRGLYGGKWSVSVTGFALLIGVASLLLLFGQYALWTIGVISVIYSIYFKVWKLSGI